MSRMSEVHQTLTEWGFDPSHAPGPIVTSAMDEVMQRRTSRQTIIDRATAKAQEQAVAGNIPTLLRTIYAGEAIRETWAINSRTSAGVSYTVALTHRATGIWTNCDCAAADEGRICWHRAAARLAHTDAIASRNVAGLRIRPQQQPAMAAD